MIREDLDRDSSIQASVTSAVDFSHPARAQRREDLVRAKSRAGSKSHRFNAAFGVHLLLATRESYVLELRNSKSENATPAARLSQLPYRATTSSYLSGVDEWELAHAISSDPPSS